MGYKRFCDATRELEKVPGTFKEFGQVLKRQYSREPAQDVTLFYKLRDELHDRIATEFRAGLADLTEQLIEKWPEIYLPDETDEVAEKRIASMLLPAQEGKGSVKPKRKATRKKRVPKP